MQACPTMKLFISWAILLVPSATAAGGRPPPPPPPPSFGFSPVLGDWMVLQQSPAAAAVYGVAPESATGVMVTVSDGKSSYDVVAKVGKDATHQPYGYVDTKTGANLPVQNFTWKALLHPTAAGGDYTITAKCTGCTNTSTATLAHVTFGDMWYCSGKPTAHPPARHPGPESSSTTPQARATCGSRCCTRSRATRPWQRSSRASTRTSAGCSAPRPRPQLPASGRRRSRRSRTATRPHRATACSRWAPCAGTTASVEAHYYPYRVIFCSNILN